MMDSHDTDKAIRTLYRRLEPRVNTQAFEASLGKNVGRKHSRLPRTRRVRALALACLTLVLIAGLVTGIFEASRHLGKDRSILVLSDQTTGPQGPGGSSQALLSNPYPTPNSTGVSGTVDEGPSPWAENLGKAVLALYPGKGWRVARAVEQASVLMDIIIVPAETKGSGKDATLLDGAHLRMTIHREESGKIPAGDNPMQYPEFDTPNGHGLIMPSYDYGNGHESLITWFVRPDKLMIQVGVAQALRGSSSAALMLDKEGVKKLLTYIASIIEMGDTDSPTSTLPSANSNAPEVSPEAKGYVDQLTSMWQSAGIPVLRVTTSPGDPNTEKMLKDNTKTGDVLPFVALELPASVFSSMDYSFVICQIQRLTVTAIRQGVPLHYLEIVKVDGDGSKTMYSLGEVYQLSAAAGPEWDKPATLGLKQTTDRLRKIAQEGASASGVTLESFEVTEDPSGRVITAVGSVPDRSTVAASVKQFSAPLETAGRTLNKDGAKISGLNVKVDDQKGAPVFRRVVAYNVGQGLSTRWMAPELEAAQSQ